MGRRQLNGGPAVRAARVMNARVITVSAAMLLAAILTGCGPGDAPRDTSSSASGTVAPTDAAKTPTPTPTVTPIALPTDCRAILSDDVLAQLGDHPLNHEAYDDVGVLADGSLRCRWRDPSVDITGLQTLISRVNRGEALEMLNGLMATEGFICYESEGGSRCERERPSAQYPVIEGRTLFLRDDVLIDTEYWNLAPTGYTSSIIAHLWP